MRIRHAMNGITDWWISVSHIKLDACYSLTLIHERQKYGWPFQITKEGYRSNIQSSVVMITMRFCGKTHIFIHAFYAWCIFRSIKFNANKTLFLHWSTNNTYYVYKRSSKNRIIQRYGASHRTESFQKTPLWCCTMAQSDSLSFLTICLIW